MRKKFKRYNEMTKGEKDKIVEDYLSGINLKDIYKKYDIYQYIFEKIRKEYSLTKRMKYYSEKEIDAAISDFQSGMNYSEIKNKHGISDTQMVKHLKDRGLSHYNNKGRKNKFNQDYFEEINTPSKAYFLGFLYADGSIYKANKSDPSPVRVRLNISEEDIEILKNLCHFIEYNPDKIETYTPKGTFSGNKMSKLTINSKKLCDDMISKEFRLLKKESNGDIFNHIPRKLWSHFIRGLNDGDGNTSNRIFSITNQISMINKIQDIIEEEVGIKKSVSSIYSYENRGYSTTRDLRYTRKTSVDIFRYIYKDSTKNTRLSRKYNNVKHLI